MILARSKTGKRRRLDYVFEEQRRRSEKNKLAFGSSSVASNHIFPPISCISKQTNYGHRKKTNPTVVFEKRMMPTMIIIGLFLRQHF